MIINSLLVNELFRAFHIQRWNDRIRPMDFTEMDKHAHKMIIAYVIGKYEEANGNNIDWLWIIRSEIYELLRRIVISDIKSPIYYEIKQNKEVFRELNTYIYKELETKITDTEFKKELKDYIRANLNIEIDICREKYIKPIFKDSILKETVYVE